MQVAEYLLEVQVECYQLTLLRLGHLQTWAKLAKLVCSSLYFSGTALTVFLALADADPLGVNQNVTFDEVGGLDDRRTLLHTS